MSVVKLLGHTESSGDHSHWRIATT